MKLPGAWIRAAKWSTYGASVSLPNAWLAWRNCPDRVALGLFPPEVVVEVKALACELPSQRQVPLARWSVPEITRHAVESGLVPASAIRPSGAGFTKTPFGLGNTAAGFSRAIQTLPSKPDVSWTFMKVSGRINHCARMNLCSRLTKRPASRLGLASMPANHPSPIRP